MKNLPESHISKFNFLTLLVLAITATSAMSKETCSKDLSVAEKQLNEWKEAWLNAFSMGKRDCGSLQNTPPASLLIAGDTPPSSRLLSEVDVENLVIGLGMKENLQTYCSETKGFTVDLDKPSVTSFTKKPKDAIALFDFCTSKHRQARARKDHDKEVKLRHKGPL